MTVLHFGRVFARGSIHDVITILAWPRFTWARPAMSTDAFLEVSGLWARYGATPILQGVDLAVNKGEIVSLIGRNGVGKTTTMRCLIGSLGAAAGNVRFLGRDVTRLPAESRARLGMGYIPQGRHVFPRMTVEENLGDRAPDRWTWRQEAARACLRILPAAQGAPQAGAGTMSGGSSSSSRSDAR